MDLGNVLLGTAAIISALAALFANINRRRQQPVEKLCEDLSELKEDICVIKQASFFSLQAHVEQGANGDVKKAYEKLKGSVFKD
jgi:hypothetical protein